MKATKKSLPAKPDAMTAPASLQLTAKATIDLDAAVRWTAGPSLPRFRMVAYTGSPMRVGGWRYPVIIDLAGLVIPSQSRPIRFGHDPLAGVGHTDAIRVEQGQLVATGVVSRDTAAAREVVASSKNGFPWQASVGASVDEFEFVKESQKVTVNGQQYTGPLNVVRKATLGEISFVDLGADGATSASVAAGAELQAGDTHVEDATPQETDEQTVPALSTGIARHADCRSSIRQRPLPQPPWTTSGRERPPKSIALPPSDGSVADVSPSIESRAIREGWNEQRTELEMLRNTRPAAPAVHVPETTITGSVLEAACFMAGRMPELEANYDERTLELAARRFRGGIGLQELLLEAAWINGYTGRNFRDSRAVLRYAFGHSVEAAFSTIDIGGILSNVANKFLLEGFFSVERTWRNICAVRNVSDFKTVTSYRLIGKDQYELVNPGGELKHGTLGNEQYTQQGRHVRPGAVDRPPRHHQR